MDFSSIVIAQINECIALTFESFAFVWSQFRATLILIKISNHPIIEVAETIQHYCHIDSASFDIIRYGYKMWIFGEF